MMDLKKICTKCNELRSIDEFPIQFGRKRKDGSKKQRIGAQCKHCINQKNKKWRDNNKEKVKEIRKASRLKNIEKCNQRTSEWKRKNKDRVKAQARLRYRKNNPAPIKKVKLPKRLKAKGQLATAIEMFVSVGVLSLEECTLLYYTWRGMIARCSNPSHPKFPDYGLRGINVCEDWVNNFVQFIIDMGPKPNYQNRHYTIERIDNDKGYSAKNCKWATQKEQQNNKRTNLNSTSESYPDRWIISLIRKTSSSWQIPQNEKPKLVELKSLQITGKRIINQLTKKV